MEGHLGHELPKQLVYRFLKTEIQAITPSVYKKIYLETSFMKQTEIQIGPNLHKFVHPPSYFFLNKLFTIRTPYLISLFLIDSFLKKILSTIALHPYYIFHICNSYLSSYSRSFLNYSAFLSLFSIQRSLITYAHIFFNATWFEIVLLHIAPFIYVNVDRKRYTSIKALIMIKLGTYSKPKHILWNGK